MNIMPILLAILPVFLMIGLGCLTQLTGILNSESEKGITNLVLWILYPCLVLSKVPGNESLQSGTVVFSALAAGFLITVLAFAIAWAVGGLIKIEDAGARSTFCVSAALQNYGFIPIPLILALFESVEAASGNSLADETLGVLFVHNLGLEIAMWTIGLALLSGKSKGALKKLVNGPTIAIGTAMILNFTGSFRSIPTVITEPMKELGNCSIPVSLILVGAALAGVVRSEKWSTKWNIVSAALVTRFAVMPLVILIVAKLVSFSPTLQRVLIVQAAMPAAVFPIVLAKHYDGKPGVAVQIVIATSLVSLLLTPALLALAFRYFGIEY